MSFGVSIVLYHHTQDELASLLQALRDAASVQAVWLVDNEGCGWAAALQGGGSKFHYIQAPRNGGFGYGHNLAIHRATGQCSHHIICNPDILVTPQALDALDMLVQSRPEALCMPDVVYPDGTRQELCKLLPSPLNLFARRFVPALAERLDHRYLLRDADYSQPFFAPSLSGCFMVCRTDALQASGGFDERYFMYMEDVDLSRRLAEQGGAVYLPQVTVVHAFQKGSYKNPLLFKYHIQSAVRYFNKWGWLVDSGRRRLNKKCLGGLPRKALTRTTQGTP